MAAGVSCTIGKDNEKYFFYRGRRISEEAARRLRAGRKTRVAKCKRLSSAKTAKAAKGRGSSAKTAKAAAKRRSSSGRAKAKRGAQAKRREEEEIIFVEPPPDWARLRSEAAKRAAAKSRSRTTSDLLIFEGAVPKRSSSGRRQSDLIIFEEIPSKRGSAARRGLPRPEGMELPPAPPSGSARRSSQRAPQLLNILPLPLGAPNFPPPPLPPASKRRVASAPAKRSSAVQQRMSERAHQRAAVWKLEPFGEDVNDRLILIPSRRVDIIDRKELLTPSYRHQLYRMHNARPGTLVWVDKRTDDLLREINQQVSDWELRAWTIYSQKEIMRNLNVIRP